MRTAMRHLGEAQIREEQAKRLENRKRIGESLVRGLARRPCFGKGIKEACHKHPDRVMRLAFAVKNVEEHLAGLAESQISGTLGTTPENILRALRLGYLNTCRQDPFREMGLATAHGIFFYLEPKYRKTLRGANAGDIMYESKSWRPASDEGEWAAKETPNGTVKTFTFEPSAAEVPLTPYTVKIIIGGGLAANDNGKGIISGAAINGGAIRSITPATAPVSATAIVMAGFITLEKNSDLEITRSVELSLRACPFTLREHPITASFSKRLELTLGTSYKVV